MLRQIIQKIPAVKNVLRRLNNQNARDVFVLDQLARLPAGIILLDAGCGSQRYREYCKHITYKAQDFGQYKTDQKTMLGSVGLGGTDGYQYGKLDYVGNIWNIPEKDKTFDAVLCTEVFEHIPFPIETVKEFSRLLKDDGVCIITAPSNCLRHMDPFFYYSGFTDRWFESVLVESGMEIEKIEPVGDYYSWLAVEVARTISTHSIAAKIILFPAFLYYYFKVPTQTSIDTLCMGYHVVARKKRMK